MNMTIRLVKSVCKPWPRCQVDGIGPILRNLIIATIVLFQLAGVCVDTEKGYSQVRQLERGDAPIGNPLQGLVPYSAPTPNRFPHSMEFDYLGLARLVIGEGEYDWQPIEKMLDEIAGRGNQAVLRIYMEYPGKQDGIPEYLRGRGVKIHEYMNENTASFPAQKCGLPITKIRNCATCCETLLRRLASVTMVTRDWLISRRDCWAHGASGTRIPGPNYGPVNARRQKFWTPTKSTFA